MKLACATSSLFEKEDPPPSQTELATEPAPRTGGVTPPWGKPQHLTERILVTGVA